MFKNIKKVFRKVCPFKTYSLFLPLILSYNQQMGGLLRMNRLDWLTNAFPPPYVDTMSLEVWGGGKMLTIKTCWDKALLALCPWRLETSHISILESRRSDERCSWVKHRINYIYVGRYSFFAIRKQCELCVFSFYSKRQCEGPQTWNKWKDPDSHFFPYSNKPHRYPHRYAYQLESENI